MSQLSFGVAVRPGHGGLSIPQRALSWSRLDRQMETGNQISEKLGQMVRALSWNVKRFKSPVGIWFMA